VGINRLKQCAGGSIVAIFAAVSVVSTSGCWMMAAQLAPYAIGAAETVGEGAGLRLVEALGLVDQHQLFLFLLRRMRQLVGFDVDLLRSVGAAVRLPVIASGGVGTLQHFVEGAEAGATGLLAASVFHFGTFTIAQVKEALAEAGLPVRLPRMAA